MSALVGALLQKQPDARPCMADVLDLVLVRVHLRAYASAIGLTSACAPPAPEGGAADASSTGQVGLSHSLLELSEAWHLAAYEA